MLRIGLIVGLVLLQVGCDDDDGGASDAANATTFDVPLTRGEEVPVCASAGASATGAARVVISPDDSMVTADTLMFSGLSGPATAAHIHAGGLGVAGPIVFDLGPSPISPTSPTRFTAADYPSPPPAGAPASFADFIRAMKAGQSYVNVHTAACASGEVRGQLD